MREMPLVFDVVCVISTACPNRATGMAALNYAHILTLPKVHLVLVTVLVIQKLQKHNTPQMHA